MTPMVPVPVADAAPGRADRLRAVGAQAADRLRRSLGELVWCLLTVAFGVTGFLVIALSLAPGTAWSAVRGAILLATLLVGSVATGAARGLGSGFRALDEALLGERVPAPPAPPSTRSASRRQRIAGRLRDTADWRALGFVVLRLVMQAPALFAVVSWLGVVNLTYPFWWRLFRNHPPGTTLRPVPYLTPVGVFQVRTYPGTVLVFAVGIVMVLAAAWVTHAVTWVDRWLARGLLGPGRLAERVRTLEENRTQVLDASAATLRRIERDLHDGTQAQLATLAMNLGQAKEKLQPDTEVPYDPLGALSLIDAAHAQVKEALVELRNIARGIHPPALDVGLDAALTTLVARSAVPAVLTIDGGGNGERPDRAIETIAYFSAAELLANVARHSGAHLATVAVRLVDGRRLRLTVTDNGRGGAAVVETEDGSGTGLAGLAERVRAVDGSLVIDSPPGGPTAVTVELPIHT
jgi:signal transduction histidine kinase